MAQPNHMIDWPKFIIDIVHMGSRVGKNRLYQVCVRGFKSQCNRVHFGRTYSECSAQSSTTLTAYASLSISLSSFLSGSHSSMLKKKYHTFWAIRCIAPDDKMHRKFIRKFLENYIFTDQNSYLLLT